VALLKRLESDKSLAAFAGQFVPLKLVTDGNPQWSKWARQYPVEGRGIPRLYVVRADGEKLYGGVGSLKGDALPQMLFVTLQKSGRTFSDVEAGLLKSSVEAAEKEMAEKNHGQAAVELSKLTKLGTLGDFKSYAEPSLKADQIAKTLIRASDSVIDDAVAKLDNAQAAFAGALALTEAERQYAGFATIKRRVSAALKTAKRNKDISPYIAQAEAITRARRLLESERATVRKKAPEAYENVIRRYPGTQADKFAREELAAISPNAKILTEVEPTKKPALRTWTDSSGKFKVRATLVKLEGNKVTLKKESGGEITISSSKLSNRDQEFLRSVEK
jgi:hypothetical protein